MEQWMKDGRHILYERWQSMGGVVGSKAQPQQVKDVDDAVLKHVLAVFTKNRLHACVSSPLLHKANCRLVAIDEADEPSLHFKFPCGRFFPGIDRSGFFGFVQRQFHSSDFLSPAVLHSATTSSPSSSASPHRNVVPLMPKHHARVLVDYMWIYQGRIYDYTSDFSFIAGAGVVPQALEESVLYCNRNRHTQSVDAVYLAARTWDDSEEEQHRAKEELGMFDEETGKKFDSRLVEGAVFLDEMDQFLCDSGFAFRDEGTKLPATEFNVGYDVKTGKVMAVKATEPPMVIPGDATVALFVRVKKFCDPVSATKHIEIAEKLKKKGNDILQGGAETTENNNNSNSNEQQQQQKNQGQKAISARQWYECAMMELSPEALRISEKTGGSGELQNKEITGKIQNLLASLAHNISLSYFEEAMYRGNVEFTKEQLAADEKLRIKVQNTRQHLLKKSITFATEAVKASGNKHTKSIFRRAIANFHLGNYDEATSDLKLIETISGVEAASKDASVVGLMNQIQSEIKKADDAIRHAMQKELGKQKE